MAQWAMASRPARPAITRAWLSASNATMALQKAKQLPSIARLRSLVDAGAIVPVVGLTPYRQATQADDAAALGVLLDGSEHLAPAYQWTLVAQAIRLKAPRCLALMLERGFPLERPAPPARPGPHQEIAACYPDQFPTGLGLAVENNRIKCASLLLAAHAARGQAPDPGACRHVRNPRALRFLVARGLVPDREHMEAAVFLGADPSPNVPLLEAFLQAGVALRARPKRGEEAPAAWSYLLGDVPDNQALDPGFMDRAAACARVLLREGCAWEPEMRAAGIMRLDPYAMAVLIRAGVPAPKVAARADRKYVPRSSALESRRDPQPACDRAAEQLRFLARSGVDTDVFWNPDAPSEWRQAMARCGVRPGKGASGIREADLLAGARARLEDRLVADGPAAVRRPDPRL